MRSGQLWQQHVYKIKEFVEAPQLLALDLLPSANFPRLTRRVTASNSARNSGEKCKRKRAGDGLNDAPCQRLLEASAISRRRWPRRAGIERSSTTSSLGSDSLEDSGSHFLHCDSRLYYGVDGQLKTHQYRPDRPRLDAKGRPRDTKSWGSRLSWMRRRAADRAFADPTIPPLG